MELLCVLPPLAALWLLCAFLTLRGRLAPALAPLPALALLITALTVFGMAGVLAPGMWALLLLCAALGAWALVPHGGCRPDLRRLFSPGAVLFWAGALAFAVYFAVRQPMATGFDELNLWATAVKVTVTDDALYATAELGVPWPVTQNPGLPLLGYFFSFFGAYADWKIYFAYDVLFLAVDAAVLGALPWRRYRLWVPLAAILWCVPWFFTTYNHTVYLNTVYMSAYGDIPAGLVTGGAVALWLALRAGGTPRTAWAVLPVLALAANLKANTFVLALVAAGLVALDALLFPVGEAPFAKGLGRRAGFAAACFAAPLGIYYLWNVRYVGWLAARNAAAGGMGETSLPLSGVVVNGLRLLLGGSVPPEYAARGPQFRRAMADMGAQFWGAGGRLTMVGQGCVVTALILAVFAAACLLAGKGWRRPAVLGAASLTCFGGYNLMLALSYGFIFKPFQAEALADYNRYIYSYYIAWFLVALVCLVQALAALDPQRHRALAGQALVLVLAAGMLLRWHQLVLPQLSVLGFSDSEFIDRRRDRDEAAAVSRALDETDRIFFVSQGDNGQRWFSAVFDFYPLAVDYSGTVEQGGGGGTFGLAALEPADEGVKKYYYHPYTAAELDAAVRQSGCTVLYIQALDDIFVQSYAELFTDGLAAAQDGTTPIYRVTDAGFAPEPLPDPLPAGAAAMAALREVAP